MILGVLGREVVDGDFVVLDYCVAGLAPQPPLRNSSTPTSLFQQQNNSGSFFFFCGSELLILGPRDGAAVYVALVSGLKVGKDSRDSLPLQLLVDYLTGKLGDPTVIFMEY